MILHLAAVLLAAAAPARSQGAAPAASAASALAQSTATVSTLYTGDRARDPFSSAGSGASGGARKAEEDPKLPATADIHALTLKGFLKDKSADFAMFASDTGETFMLRGGRLYNARNKPVPNVRGWIELKQKRVILKTTEGDVQPFILGEDREKAAEDEKKKAEKAGGATQ